MLPQNIVTINFNFIFSCCGSKRSEFQGYRVCVAEDLNITSHVVPTIHETFLSDFLVILKWKHTNY